MAILSLSDLLQRALRLLRRSSYGAPSRHPGSAYQVAALPVKLTRTGKMKVLLVSARGGSGKLIVPRGWPMKGKADFQAAATEAEEEAGVLGPVTPDRVGTYEYRSDRKAAGGAIRVDVYRLDVKRQVPKFKEKGQRRPWSSSDISGPYCSTASGRIASRHVRTLHPTLHLAAGSRVPERHRSAVELAAPLQHRPDDDHRRCPP